MGTGAIPSIGANAGADPIATASLKSTPASVGYDTDIAGIASIADAPDSPDEIQKATNANATPAGRTDARSKARRDSLRRGVTFIAIVVVLSLVAAFGWRWWTGREQSGAGATLGGGSIAVGIIGDVQSIDLLASTDSQIEQALLGNVAETLTTLDGNNQAAPGLATSWETSTDGLTTTLHLRQGVTFSNGNALDATAVMRWIQTIVQTKPANVHAFDNLSAVNSPDANTVTLTFSQPNPDLAWQLAGKAGAIMDVQSANTTDAANGAIGSGPFTVAGFEAGKSVTLKRNDAYWGTPAQLASVTLRYYASEDTLVTALKYSEVEAAVGLTKASGDALVTAGGFEAKQGTSTGSMVLAFNGGTLASLTSDRVMRQSIRHALDHDAIIASRGGGDTKLAGPITSLDPGYEDLTGAIPAGDMNQVAFIGGTTYNFRLIYPQRYGQAIGDLIAAQLAASNIHVTPTMVDDATWQQQVIEKKDFDMTLMDLDDGHDLDLFADPSQVWGFDNPTVEQLVAQADVAKSMDEYADLSKQAAAIVNEESPVDWLLEYHPTTVWKTGVSGMPTDLTGTRLALAGVKAH